MYRYHFNCFVSGILLKDQPIIQEEKKIEMPDTKIEGTFFINNTDLFFLFFFLDCLDVFVVFQYAEFRNIKLFLLSHKISLQSGDEDPEKITQKIWLSQKILLKNHLKINYILHFINLLFVIAATMSRIVMSLISFM